MIKTKSGLPKHCYWQVDRHGHRRVRFRRSGVSIYLTGTPWSESFMHQYAIAVDRAQAPTADGSDPRSIDALVASYRELVFPTLAATTRDMRGRILARFCGDFGRDLAANFEHQHISAIIGKKVSGSAGSNTIRSPTPSASRRRGRASTPGPMTRLRVIARTGRSARSSGCAWSWR
jgi:hypothetical protein